MLRKLFRNTRRFRGNEKQAQERNLATTNDATGNYSWLTALQLAETSSYRTFGSLLTEWHSVNGLYLL